MNDNSKILKINMKQDGISSSLSVRMAVAEDHDIINALYMSVKGRDFCIWNDEYPEEEDIDVDITKSNLLVLTNGTEIVGALSIIDETEWEELGVWSVADHVAVIARVCIAPSWQGHGLSAMLLQESERILLARGCKGIRLLVARKHLPAIKTYLNAGYEIMGRCSMYGHEYYACEKVLSESLS